MCAVTQKNLLHKSTLVAKESIPVYIQTASSHLSSIQLCAGITCRFYEAVNYVCNVTFHYEITRMSRDSGNLPG